MKKKDKVVSKGLDPSTTMELFSKGAKMVFSKATDEIEKQLQAEMMEEYERWTNQNYRPRPWYELIGYYEEKES